MNLENKNKQSTQNQATPNFKSVVLFLLVDFGWLVTILGMVADHPWYFTSWRKGKRKRSPESEYKISKL